MEPNAAPSSHFKGKDAVDHVIEAKARGIVEQSETHGEEIPGHLSSGADAIRETAFVLLLLWTFLYRIQALDHFLLTTVVFSVGWIIWKAGRSAWLAWSRLERLHRLVAEEKWEIDHHREQEREELAALYEAKGFKGKLLEDVLDVLMSDEDRLLRVMLEEELCLTLEKQEHPLKQALGAAVGVILSSLVVTLFFLAFSSYGIIFGALLLIGIGGAVSAHYDRNRRISAFVWNIGIASLGFGAVYFLWETFA